MLVEIWLFASALAHLHGGLPHFAATQLNDKTNMNPILTAYREWCTTDRRYCEADAAVQSFQLLTFLYAFPACLLLIYARLAKKPWRHLLQLVLCVGQAYGTIIYLLSARFDQQGGVNGRPLYPRINNDPAKFFGLFLGLNGLWIVVPAMLGYSSAKEILSALNAKEKTA